MARFPSHFNEGEGVILEVLGKRGEPGVETLSILREYDLPETFDEDVLDDAREQAKLLDETVPKGRDDLTTAATTIITIDPVDARDFDDAISLTQDEQGFWRLGVHIADVSHFVRPGSPLDVEARQRATSVYLPDRVIPMLPELISNGLASLQPDRVRLTKSASIEYSPEGVPTDVEFANSAIRSSRRFTYEEVDQYLADPEAWRDQLTPEVHALLGRMRDLARILRARRRTRGALEMSMPEVKVDLGSQGEVIGAHVVQDTESHQIIEEFMLAANEAVAERLARAGLHFLRRVHYSPDPRKARVLSEFVRDLGIHVDSMEDRFELQRVLKEAHDRPERYAVNYAVLRSMQRAIYSPEDAGHFALASDCYCHFTSPIRRYPDLTVHRLLDDLIRDRKPANKFEDFVALGQHCSDQEKKAEEAERELTKVKLLMYLATRVGMKMEGVVTGVEEFGLFVQGIELPAEGLVHISSLADDYYSFDRRGHRLAGRREGNTFRLGDRLQVTVARVDLDRRELDFRLVSKLKRTAPAEGSASAAGPFSPAGQGKRRKTTKTKKRPTRLRDRAKKKSGKKRR